MAAPVRQLRGALKKSSPGLRHERAFWDSGVEYVVGMDEVGKGAWAGPLTVGAAIVPKDRRIYKVRDSKLLTEAEREAMFDRISNWCEAWAVGHASHAECDELGMSEAQRLAARRALDGLGVQCEKVLLDGKWDFVGGGRASTIVRGERVSLSIAAASILAKVTRDRMMREMDEHFPAFAFSENKGYPCHRHRAALQMLGPTTIHRRSWAFMESLAWRGIERYVPDNGQGTLFI
ncbi:MAG: ribonuclease HII [Acidimicrobiia bacterium]|nr:ribonuclease HII [Acidimicrobiia bacterium]